MSTTYSTLLTALGLRASDPLSPPQILAPTFLIFNFVSAYALLSTRGVKRHYGFDHQASPREDVVKYGEALVTSGKISRSTLNRIKRWESAHANAVEHFPLFVAGVLMAVYKGADANRANFLMLAYTLARTLYGVVYIGVENEQLAFVRAILWWTSNFMCFRLIAS